MITITSLALLGAVASASVNITSNDSLSDNQTSKSNIALSKQEIINIVASSQKQNTKSSEYAFEIQALNNESASAIRVKKARLQPFNSSTLIRRQAIISE